MHKLTWLPGLAAAAACWLQLAACLGCGALEGTSTRPSSRVEIIVPDGTSVCAVDLVDNCRSRPRGTMAAPSEVVVKFVIGAGFQNVTHEQAVSGKHPLTDEAFQQATVVYQSVEIPHGGKWSAHITRTWAAEFITEALKQEYSSTVTVLSRRRGGDAHDANLQISLCVAVGECVAVCELSRTIQVLRVLEYSSTSPSASKANRFPSKRTQGRLYIAI